VHLYDPINDFVSAELAKRSVCFFGSRRKISSSREEKSRKRENLEKELQFSNLFPFFFRLLGLQSRRVHVTENHSHLGRHVQSERQNAGHRRGLIAVAVS
jgi:hypothetical protein